VRDGKLLGTLGSRLLDFGVLRAVAESGRKGSECVLLHGSDGIWKRFGR
jgi:hypothetical protein